MGCSGATTASAIAGLRWISCRARGTGFSCFRPSPSDADEFLDPRAAFCEGDVSEVWTQPRTVPERRPSR
jgi:hypothetical protein